MHVLIPAAALALCLAAPSAWAMPGMSSSSGGAGDDAQVMDGAVRAFQKADANGDDRLTRDEFLKAFPGMKEAAFEAIDTDHDGLVGRQEWQAFAIGHSMGRRSPMGGMPPAGAGKGLPPVTAPGAAPGLPAVTPPAGAGLPPVTAPEGR